MSRVPTPLMAFLMGCPLFLFAFVAAFNGADAVAILVLLSYSLVGFALGDRDPASWSLSAILLVVPAVPVAGLFFVALLEESSVPSALAWGGGLVAALGLALAGSAIGAWRARAERP